MAFLTFKLFLFSFSGLYAFGKVGWNPSKYKQMRQMLLLDKPVNLCCTEAKD